MRVKSIATCGKGGTGKTVFTALMTGLLAKDRKFKILVIDADPAMGLPAALGVTVNKTLENIREEIIKSAKTSKREEKIWIAEMLDYEVLNALSEGSGFGLLVMGRQESAGCFCPANALLKDAIDSLSKSFDIVLIDGEAGLEQINRGVMGSVDILAITTDLTKRSMQTAKAIERVAHRLTKARAGLVVNRVKEGEEELSKNLARDTGIEIFGLIPEDKNITKWDLLGGPIIDIPDTSPSVIAVQQIIENIL